MTNAQAIDPAQELRLLAEELYAFLKALEPSRWRRELEPTMRDRLEGLRTRLSEVLERHLLPVRDEAMATLRERLVAVREVLDGFTPTPDLSSGQVAAQWGELRVKLLPAYEAVAASLKVQSIHVPSLRPRNYTRNLFHVLSGVGVLALIHHILPLNMLAITAGIFVVLAWSMEISRRFSDTINGHLMKLFGPVAHPHERFRVNSATWYTTALLMLASFMEPLACSLAVAVLAVSDPMAAIIGRRFGRHKITAGRTLEGSLAFVVTGVLAAFGVMAVYYPELSLGAMALYAFGGAVPGAIAEVVSERIDDNFSIPMTVACGVTVVTWLFF